MNNEKIENIRQEYIEKVINFALDLKIRKMNDYGVEIGKHKYGLKGIVFDLARKFYRIENIVLGEKNIQVSNENLYDTFIDIINYAIDGAYYIKINENKNVLS